MQDVRLPAVFECELSLTQYTQISLYTGVSRNVIEIVRTHRVTFATSFALVFNAFLMDVRHVTL